MWRSIKKEDDYDVLLQSCFEHTGAVYMSKYGYGKVMIELANGKTFYGDRWSLKDIRALYARILKYKRTKGWKP